MQGGEREKIEEFIKQLVQKLPPAFANMREELTEQLRAGLEPLLHKMNLVSREEYDIQVELLERLRKRVAELEQRLDRDKKQDEA